MKRRDSKTFGSAFGPSTLVSAPRFAGSPPITRRSSHRRENSIRHRHAGRPATDACTETPFMAAKETASRTGAAPQRYALGFVFLGLFRRRRGHFRRPRARARMGSRRFERRVPLRRRRLCLHRPCLHGTRRHLSRRRRRPILRDARPRRYLRIHRRLGGASRLHDRRYALCVEFGRLQQPARPGARQLAPSVAAFRRRARARRRALPAQRDRRPREHGIQRRRFSARRSSAKR